MNESGQFFVRLQFVPEPNAGTPRKRYRFCSAALVRRRQNSKRGRGGQLQFMNRIHAFAAGGSHDT
jgi:hypothetical protein